MLVIPWKQDISYQGYSIPWKQRNVSYYPEAKRWDDIPEAGEDMMSKINAIEPNSYYNIEKVKKILKNGNRGRAHISRINYRFIVVDGNMCWVTNRVSYRPEKDDIHYGLWKPDKLNLVMSGQYGDRVDVPPLQEMKVVEGTWLYIPKWSVAASLPSGGDYEVHYQFNACGFDPGKIVRNVSFCAYFIKRNALTRKFTISKFDLEFKLNRDTGCYDAEGNEEWIWHRNPHNIGTKFDIKVLGGTTLNTLEDIGPFKTDSTSELYDKLNYFLYSVPYSF